MPPQTMLARVRPTELGIFVHGLLSSQTSWATCRAHLLAALCQHYRLTDIPTLKVCCDNKTALFRTQAYHKRIPFGSPQADVN